MGFTDIFLLAIIAAGAVYGGLRGIRPALYLLVAFLASILAVQLFTGSLENLILDYSGVGADKYPGAPAVAVLILEDRSANAYLAAFIPSILTGFCLLALIVGGILLGPYFYEASRSVVSRITGTICGAVAGGASSLLVIVQLMRLPWPPAGSMFRGSVIIAAVNKFAEFLLPALAGGL